MHSGGKYAYHQPRMPQTPQRREIALFELTAITLVCVARALVTGIPQVKATPKRAAVATGAGMEDASKWGLRYFYISRSRVSLGDTHG
jgi:hypothetical protein